jgi:hypothetical protein
MRERQPTNRLDPTRQIRLLVKLKLMKCAPISRYAEIGFFHGRLTRLQAAISAVGESARCAPACCGG